MGVIEKFPDNDRLWLTAYVEAFETLHDPEDLRNAGRLLIAEIRHRKEIFFRHRKRLCSCESEFCQSRLRAGSDSPMIDLDEVRRRAAPCKGFRASPQS